MRVFRTVHGEQVDVIAHIKEMVSKYPDVEIHIGSDSQNPRRKQRKAITDDPKESINGKKTSYATTIVFVTPLNRGAHFIAHRFKTDLIENHEERLRKETELSLEVAWSISEKLPTLPLQIDVDYSPTDSKEKYISSKLTQWARGWVTGMGYKVNIKPDKQWATKASDHICRYGFSRTMSKEERQQKLSS